MAIIADEVFLDYSLSDELPVSFSANQRSLDVHPERALEDFRATADEGCMDRRQRSNRPEAGSARPARNHRRHLPVHERSSPVGCAGDAGRTPQRPAATHGPHSHQSGGARLPLGAARSFARDWRSKADGMPSSACRPWAPTKISPSLCSSALEFSLQPGHFYNFPSDGYLVVSLITPSRNFEPVSAAPWNTSLGTDFRPRAIRSRPQ